MTSAAQEIIHRKLNSEDLIKVENDREVDIIYIKLKDSEMVDA